MRDEDMPRAVNGRRPLCRRAAFCSAGSTSGKRTRRIVEAIKSHGALFHAVPFTHSYMLAGGTVADHLSGDDAWFAGMDEVPGYNPERRVWSAAGIIAHEPHCARSMRPPCYPAWGQARLRGMIANRPDWTLSRQRQWGVRCPSLFTGETR